MALKSTIIKAQLSLSDMDRHIYQDFNLTLAQHPSETEQR
ncbi:YaeQ family protein, partial [Pseudoalteromonas sp.]